MPVKNGMRRAQSVRITLRGQPVSFIPSWVIMWRKPFAIFDCNFLKAESRRSARMPVTISYSLMCPSSRLKSSGVV